MTPTPIPVALRAYTVRAGTPPSVEPQPLGATATKPARPRGPEPLWQKRVVIFDTETTIDPSQRLTFGSYRVCRWTRDGRLELIAEGLFHADDLEREDPNGFEELRRYATANALPLLSRRCFLDRVFRRVALDIRGTVVGFNLPFDLSRLAIESGEARGFYRGGFSFALWDYLDKRTGRHVEHRYRPRVCIKSLDSKRAFIGFTRPKRGEEKAAPAFRGHFLDLRTLAFALTAQAHSLASACKAFGVTHGKTTAEVHGRITAAYIAYNRRDVLATQELLERLRPEFDRHRLTIPPTRAFSPASIAKAYLRGLGIQPLQTKAPTISPAQLGQVMTGFYGGRAECRVRRMPVPVATVDFRSMYPTVNSLMELWRILTAASVEFVDCTDAFRALIAGANVNGAFDPALWPQLACFAEIEPEGDILPVRGQYSETSRGWNIGVNVLTSAAPLIYAGPDVYASALLAGKPPRIRRAWALRGDGVQPGLKPGVIGGSIPIDPRTDDLFRTLIQERARVQHDESLAPADRDRVAQALKIFANSGSYGIFAQMDRDELPADTSETITVYGHAAPFQQKTKAPEDIGEFCFPALAALIPAAARLMLALLERCVTDRGGQYAFCDTDSMAIIATERGGAVSCAGSEIAALTWRDVSEIVGLFDRLNPYDRTIIPGSILNVEKTNYQDGAQREVSAYVISAKRYALFARDGVDALALIKVSEHGLGHLMKPLPTASADRWPDVLWTLILCEALGIPHTFPDWLRFPAVSQISVSTPAYFRGFLRTCAAVPYAQRIKPFGFLSSVQVARFGHPAGVDATAFHLLAPYSDKPGQWGAQLWTDTYSGKQYAVTTALSMRADVVRVRSIADVLEEFLAHGEVKSATADGAPAGASARGVLYRRHVSPAELMLVGKEANNIEAVERGLVCSWRSVLETYSAGAAGNVSELLTSAPAARIAAALGVSVRTVRAWRRQSRLAGLSKPST